MATPSSIDQLQLRHILAKEFGLAGNLIPLHGEVDANFKLESNSGHFLVKISPENSDPESFDFYQKLIAYLKAQGHSLPLQEPIISLNKGHTLTFQDKYGQHSFLRLFKWIEGKLWSEVNPISDGLLEDFGKKTAILSRDLRGFDHPWAHRKLDWDLAQAAWTYEALDYFEEKDKAYIKFFQDRFREEWPQISHLPASVVHNDGNDNNIVVHPFEPGQASAVAAIIDFGDAAHTQRVNNLAISCTYAIMEKADPLRAAAKIIGAYHKIFPLMEEEVQHLYTLIGIRLVISLCKSAINKNKHPNNEYLLISEKPAWNLLKKWQKVHPSYAYFSFRKSCGWPAHPQTESFKAFAQKNPLSLNSLFPGLTFNTVFPIDMSLESKWLGPRHEFTDDDLKSFRLNQLQKKHPHSLIAGGYMENRAFYSTAAYQKEGNNGPEYRTVHLGIDFWKEAGTHIYALWDGEVFSMHNNDHHKDYGPTLILKHKTDEGIPFFSLYGHLSKSDLGRWQKGDKVSKGELIAHFGGYEENGHWTPHLHFQLMLDLLGNEHDFPGVAYPEEAEIWKDLCPEPNWFFQSSQLEPQKKRTASSLISYRKKHLGKGMSISYDKHLHMVRGEGAYLIAQDGRKYLDTVNNVAHCGHEHPRIVKAGQDQMALLNTNTRYLDSNLLEFVEELLQTLPPQLSVVHMVNSGSEANELALRMAQTYTGQKDFLAIEVGYHGNTNKTIEVSSYKFDGKGGEGKPSYTHLMPLPDTFRGRYKGEAKGKLYADHVPILLDRLKRYKRKPAAFIAESILSCGGQVELPKGYLKKVYKEVRKAGGLCIADEVQTGIGRVGKHFWGFELQGVVPDILSIGKPIGNGHPIGVVVCTEEVAESFANGMEYFNTFGGNPVSSAIAREVLRVVKDEGLQRHAWKMGKALKKGLSDLQKDHPIIGDIRGQGLFLGMELTDQKLNPLAAQANYLIQRMRELGILMSTDGPDHNVLKIKPPMVFQGIHVEELLTRLDQVLKEDFMQL